MERWRLESLGGASRSLICTSGKNCQEKLLNFPPKELCIMLRGRSSLLQGLCDISLSPQALHFVHRLAIFATHRPSKKNISCFRLIPITTPASNRQIIKYLGSLRSSTFSFNFWISLLINLPSCACTSLDDREERLGRSDVADCSVSKHHLSSLLVLSCISGAQKPSSHRCDIT